MTHQDLIRQDIIDPQPWRNGIDLIREGAGESGAAWAVRPFQIVSLLEMLKAYAHDFYLIGGMLKATMKVIAKAPDDRRNYPIAPSVKKTTMTCLAGMHYHCSQVGFDLTLKGIEWAQKEAAPESFTYSQLSPVLAELERSIDRELGSILFMHVPAERAKYYPSERQKDKYVLLSHRARRKFSKSIEDGDEASKIPLRQSGYPERQPLCSAVRALYRRR